MSGMSHPDDFRDKITERQKAKKLIKELDKIEGHFEKVEHHIKPYFKFVKHG